jgi:hypothetical protein
MARWRIKNRFRKQEGTGRLRTRLDNIAIEAFGVNDASVGNREDEGNSSRVLGIHVYPGSLQRLETCCCGKS